MKAAWRFDESCDFGAANDAVRAILALWLEIDWMTEPAPGALSIARSAFERHVALARVHAPAAYGRDLCVTMRVETWSGFDALWREVTARGRRFDWKWGVLKKLLHAHRERHGFRLEASMPGVVPITELRKGAPRPLYVAMPDGGSVITLGPQVDVSADALFEASPHAPWQIAAHHHDAIDGYTSYASQDASFAIEWQLATPDAPLSENPFVPLLEVYRAGAYPFVLSAEEAVLFAFRQPTAREVVFGM